MKQYVFGSVTLPSSMKKYYKFATPKAIANMGFMGVEVAIQFFEEQSELCEREGGTFLGFAVAKDAYYDEISDIGYEIVDIVDWDGEIRLFADIGGSLYPVEDEVLDAVEASTSVFSATSLKSDRTIQEGLSWDYDGHDFTVTKILRRGWECEVTETWLSEDTGEPVSDTKVWDITSSGYDGQFITSPGGNITLYAVNADNYPWKSHRYDEFDDDWDDYDRDYAPSAYRGDYSPSAPWNAPGMSMNDFI